MADAGTDNSVRGDRRQFLRNAAAAGFAGAAMVKDALAQKPIGGSTRDQLRQDMLAAIEPDIKKDLEMRAATVEELPKPKNLKPGGMLDARFPVYYRTSVPEAMRLLTEYFAAFNDRDLAAAARTLHFPYATYEGAEPLIYKSSDEFIRNPPPSIHESDKPDSELRPGTYDIMDVLQVHTFNPVNVGLELSYSRYRADGYRIGINQGIYAITNNDGKWGIQLSSIIFTPTEYIGQHYNDAEEAMLRQGRTGMAAVGDRDYGLILGSQANRRTAPKTASIEGPPEATTFFLSAWAGKPMEPYNSKGRKSRMSVTGMPDAAEINALSAMHGPLVDYERGLNKTNIVRPSGEPGWFYAMAGGGVGHYGYPMHLADSRVLHAGPEKAHSLGGYIRYTKDNVFISETRSLGITIYDKHERVWVAGGSLGQMMRRDRTNDDL